MRRFVSCALAFSTPFLIALTIGAPKSALAQAFTVLHNFTGESDGGTPYTGLTMDARGNLYGTTSFGGAYYGGSGFGVVFKLRRAGSGWILTPLYSFTGNNHHDGEDPLGGVTFGPNGTLFGTTIGGGEFGEGTVFNLRPLPKACVSVLCAWDESMLLGFNQGSDGGFPTGNLVFDQAGNLFGTTTAGGLYDEGIVYELTPLGGSWDETVLWNFGQVNDGIQPNGGVIADNLGNLYGTTEYGGPNYYGTVFELQPSGSGWTENILYNFTDGIDGKYPSAGVVFDQVGNLYGTTTEVFELSRGSWTFTPLYSLGSGIKVYASLAANASGNLYGTSVNGGAYGVGMVFKLTSSSDGWTFTDVHDFTGGSDGGQPWSNITFDANGDLYGTASSGGAYGWGTVWEITPM